MARPRKPRRLEVHEGGRADTKKKKKQPAPYGTVPKGFEEWPELGEKEAQAAVQLVARLVKSGVGLFESHRYHLIMLAQLWVEMANYREHLMEHGPLIAGDKGVQKTNPAARLLKECRERFDQVGRRFGLTPYDWERLDADATPGAKPDQRVSETDDELEAALS